MLHTILKICLCISSAYILGIAARVWWEIKLSLLFILGFVFFGTVLRAGVFGQDVIVAQYLQSVLLCVALFTPLGYFSGLPILDYINEQQASVPYDGAERRKKPMFTVDDLDGFQEHFQAQYAKTRRGQKTSNGTSYEQYSQSRRSQSKSKKTAPPPPPQQNSGSEKDRMFSILKISNRHASPQEVKSAYRKLAWKYHPDVLAKNEMSDMQLKVSGARMQDINRAYDWLKENGFAK